MALDVFRSKTGAPIDYDAGGLPGMFAGVNTTKMSADPAAVMAVVHGVSVNMAAHDGIEGGPGLV